MDTPDEVLAAAAKYGFLDIKKLEELANDNIVEEILKVSGCSGGREINRRELGGKTQSRFETILYALALVRAQKTAQYGDDRVQSKALTVKDVLGIFYDLERKFKRLEKHLLNERGSFSGWNDEFMLETLVDLANYSIIGIQVLKREKQS